MRSRLLAGLALVAAIVLALVLLPVADALRWLSDVTESAGAAGMVVYAAVYAAATVLLVPGSALTLLAGLVYGLFGGLLVVVPGSVLGATAAAWLGRTLLRDAVQRRLDGRPRWSALDRAVSREGFRMVLLMRLSPVLPFSLLNYALGLTGVRLRDFVAASAIGMFPGTVAYVYLGTLLPDVAGLAAGVTPEGGGALRTGLLALGAVATLLLAVWLGRLARRAIAEATGAAEGGSTSRGAEPPH